MIRLRLAAILAPLFVILLIASGALAEGQKKPPKKTHLLFWQGTFESAMKMAKTLHKPMFLDFYVPNPYDKALDTITYRDPDVMYFINATCLAYRINADAIDSASKALVKQYSVEDFPTAMVTQSDGTEIDRVIGYFPPKQFLFMVENFINDTNTVGNLRRRWQADTNNLPVAYQLGQRYEMRFQLDSAMNMMRFVISHGVDTSLLVQRATFQLGAFHMRVFGNPAILAMFAGRTQVDSLRRSAYHELLTFYENQKQKDSLFATYQHAVNNYPKDADYLNNYAWALTEWKGNLDTALTLAQRAIAINPNISDYYDTMAEIYAREKDFVSAIREIKKAIWLKRDDPYLLEREKKFKTALAHSHKNGK
jgi:tetratricopeptide (TPR) repeat protein